MSIRRLFVLFLIPCFPAWVLAGGTMDDYARAKRMARDVRGKVINERLDLVWVSDDVALYKRHAQDGTWSFVKIDAVKGEKHEAFDHKAVSTSLRKLLKRDVESTRLPLTPVAMHKSDLLFQVKQQIVGVDAKSNGVREHNPEDLSALHLAPEHVKRSGKQGRDSGVLFLNRSSKSVDLLWLDSQGNAKKYKTLDPGERHKQHTFAGHVWRVRSADGENWGSFRAKPALGVVIIAGKTEAEGATKKTRRMSAVSPNGRYRVRIVNHNVMIRDTKSKKDKQLSDDGSAEDAYVRRWMWSPSSRYLMVVKQQPAQRHPVHMVHSVPKDQFQPRLITHDYLKPGDRISQPRPRLFDVKKGELIDSSEELFNTPWNIRDFSWTTGKERFRFLYNARGHQAQRMIELDPAAGKARALIDESSKTFIDYSQKTYVRPIEEGKAWLWMSERSGWNHLYRINQKTGKTKPITHGSYVVRRVLSVNDAEGTVHFEAMGVHPDQDPYHVHVGRVGLDGKNLVWLTESDGTHEVSFSASKKYYVDRYSRVDLAPVHELRRSKDGALVCELERADWQPLLDTGWQLTERFHTKDVEGKNNIWGVIHRPSTFDKTKRYPVIESIYAGPHSHFVPKSFQAWSGAKAMAELGFIVVQIDGRGTNWRHKAFHDVCWKNVADAGLADRVAWIRAAAKTRPSMDLDHVGIYGGSAGGQSALRALLMHGDFYKAAVSDCGCHDNRMDKIWWNEAWMGWPLGPHYEEQSNATKAHQLKGKLFLIVGEVDRNVDPASTMKVVDALVKADKDFDLLVMPGVGHGAAGHRYAKRRQADFFVRHLLGEEPRTK